MTAKTLSAWQASLELGFERRGQTTRLVDRLHSGPLTVQRPFYPEGGVCHVYLLHPPGGVVAGDELSIKVEAKPASHALITTPAAGKFYRSSGLSAQQTIRLKVDDDATLEWLPQETIVYQGARLSSGVQIDLASKARFIGWEILVLGRPAADEGFAEGEAVLNWLIQVDGRAFYRERLRLDQQAFVARWGLNQNSSCGTLFAYPATAAHLQAIQALIADHPQRGVTCIENLLICRALEQRADLLREFFEQVWQLLRTDIAQCPATAPRIWAT